MLRGGWAGRVSCVTVTRQPQSSGGGTETPVPRCLENAGCGGWWGEGRVRCCPRKTERRGSRGQDKDPGRWGDAGRGLAFRVRGWEGPAERTWTELPAPRRRRAAPSGRHTGTVAVGSTARPQRSTLRSARMWTQLCPSVKSQPPRPFPLPQCQAALS